MSAHTKLYRLSPDNYREIGQNLDGPLPEGGNTEGVDAPPRTSADHVELTGIDSTFAPEYYP